MVNLVKGLPEGWNEGSNGIIKSQKLNIASFNDGTINANVNLK